MGTNIYYLELMFILLNISQLWKLMKKVILTDTLFLRRKDKNNQKKNLIVNLLELIRVKKANYEASRIKTFISKFKQTIKKNNQKIKRTRRQNKTIDRSNHSIKQIAKFQNNTKRENQTNIKTNKS